MTCRTGKFRRTHRDAIVTEGANPLELVLPSKQTYASPSLSTWTGIANIAFIGAFLSKVTIYAPITARFPIPTLQARSSLILFLAFARLYLTARSEHPSRRAISLTGS